MGEIKFIDSKFISDEDGFKLTNNNDTGDFPERYVSLNHDSDHALKTIGAGSDMVTHLLPTTLADDGYFDLPAASAGFGKIEVGDAEENLIFTWARDNTVTLVDNSTNVAATDSDTDFCVFDNTSSVRIRNRLGAAKKILSDIHYTELPIAPTFQVFNILSGVDNLDPNLYINGVTVAPTFRYKLGDADAAGLESWGYGASLTLQAGTVPTYNDGSPGLGPNDDSCKFNGGGYYKNATAVNQVELEDFVIEIVWKNTDETGFLLDTLGTNGYNIYSTASGSGSINLNVNDADESLTLTGAISFAPAGRWHHGLVYVNRNEASANGSWFFINGIPGAAGLDMSTAEKTLTSNAFSIGAGSQTGNFPSNSTIAYCAMWKYTDWIQAGSTGKDEIAVIAKERFAKLCGYYPEICNGGIKTDITTSTRAFNAYIDKVEDGYRKLYYVGSEWLRMCHRQDSEEENVYGYLPETVAENVIPESEDFTTGWVPAVGPDVITNDVVACPDGRIKAASIAANATSAYHSLNNTVTLTAATYSYSMFIKPGDRTWARLWATASGGGNCYFDVANGAVGTASGVTGYIEGPFYSGDATPFYRCCIVFTATAEAHTIKVYPADSDGDALIAGTGAINLYVWGAQCELGDYMTSPVRTDGGVASRLKDDLQYVAGANIGGEDVGQGTIVCDVLLPSYDNTVSRTVATITDGGAAADKIHLYADVSGIYSPYLSTAATGLSAGASFVSADATDNTKHTLAGLWETDNAIAVIDGIADATPDTDCGMPDDLDQLDIGQYTGSILQTNGLIQNLRIYDEPTTLG